MVRYFSFLPHINLPSFPQFSLNLYVSKFIINPTLYFADHISEAQKSNMAFQFLGNSYYAFIFDALRLHEYHEINPKPRDGKCHDNFQLYEQSIQPFDTIDSWY